MGKTASRAKLRNPAGAFAPEAAPGYLPSGVSQFSRFAAAGNAQIPEHRPRKRTVSEQIDRVNRELKKTQAKLAAGGLSHGRIAKLSSDVDIKTRFLAKLHAERADLIRKGARDG